jgi:hypothetical protein
MNFAEVAFDLNKKRDDAFLLAVQGCSQSSKTAPR